MGESNPFQRKLAVPSKHLHVVAFAMICYPGLLSGCVLPYSVGENVAWDVAYIWGLSSIAVSFVCCFSCSKPLQHVHLLTSARLVSEAYA